MKNSSDLNESLSTIIITVILIVLSLIEDKSHVNSTIISKIIFFIRSIFCLIGVKLFYSLFNKKNIYSFKVSKIEIFLFVLVSYIIINRYYIQPNLGFSIRFIELIGLVCFYLIVRASSLKIYVWLLLAVIISGITQAIYGNLQLFDFFPSNHSRFKITGSFFNPGPYAGFLAAAFPIALGVYLFRKKMTSLLYSNFVYKGVSVNTITKYALEYIPLAGIISILLVLPATQSRASWLAILLSSLLLLELRYTVIKNVFNQSSTIKKSILIFGTFIIFGVGLFSLYLFKKGSSDGRLFIWKVSTEIIKENSVFGVGFDRFRAYYMNYQANYFYEKGETEEALISDNTYYAFNEFVQFTTENGIVGLILLLLILYFISKTDTSSNNLYLNYILKIGLLSIGAFACFSYPMEILPIKLIITFLLAGLSSLDSNKIVLLEAHNLKPSILLLKPLTGVGVLAIITTSFIYINQLDQSYKNWKLATNSYQYGDYESAIQEYELAYPLLKSNGEFLMNYGKALSIYKQDKKAIKILEQAKQHLNTTIIETALGDSYKNLKTYDKAEQTYKHAANMIPSRFYPLYLLAKLYEESGEKEKALAMANNILNKDIKIPSTAIKEIQQEMKDIIDRNE